MGETMVLLHMGIRANCVTGCFLGLTLNLYLPNKGPESLKVLSSI